jgi:Na+/melibiose symporter-like transporter
MTTTSPDASASLWRHADFLRLWAAQSVSSVGARITREGLPYAAVMSLGATPAQLGLLAALTRGPAILVGLAGGGFVDRGRRRPILIASDLGRALVLMSIPVAAWSQVLSMGQIYIVAALVGALSVLFDIADHAYLPSLIDRGQLIDGNSKLATTDALAEIGGPALYGLLFQFLTAPIAIAVNAGTYLFSAAALGAIGRREPTPARRPGAARHDPIADFRIGVAAALAEPSVRALLLVATAGALFGAFFSALYIVFALRVLHLTPTMLGATVATGGVAALVGAALTGRVIRRFGIGPTYVATSLVAAAGSLFIPLAHGAPWLGMAMLILSQLIGDSVGTVAEICARSLRQSLVAPDLMGRVGGVFALAPGVTGIAGALLGGWLGGAVGERATLLIGSAGLTLAAALALASPLVRRREIALAPDLDGA